MEQGPMIILGLLAAKTAVEIFLSFLNLQEGRRKRGAVPVAFLNVINQEDYDKTLDYTSAKQRFGILSEVFDAILLAVLILGVLPWTYGILAEILPSGLGWSALLMILLILVLSLPSLPLEWWMQFRIEERFGFNKSTKQLWVVDKIKGLFVAVILSWPLLVSLFWVFENFRENWWIWGWGLFFGFQLVMTVLYPMCILPLFNKLTPLEDGDLRKSLMNLADRAGFEAQTIQVIDGSKRSAHSNAYFTGFGKFRRIVLYDTLIDHLTPRELMAVLAHEIGHYKKGHVPQMLIVSAVMSLGGFWLINWLTKQDWLRDQFGFGGVEGRPEFLPALLIFSLCMGVFTFWLGPIFNFWSRKNEYEADDFAREVMDGDAQALVNALRGLHAKNLSNLVPHPAYSFFHYSHPTLLEREAALIPKEDN
ncbi:MAG: M48 family metallopeptidase [Opitutae bacterium]|jgi:STE24 endopeptidase|nr:M48 family metallopeptidase [Opitutae bacterium]MBT4225415.1 M48 family metallopeptidase [Opitutae bacterium]MBT5380327.1 M48 family metallopeptidase [Opitutae bacterium]MBT5689559.1 M48 family metallopeptidase [Opitutae bacterium]MBT6462295.1 M48 family metallopeptidase [Opitutae bacterium]